MAALRCAATIANIEGRQRIDLPSDGLETLTLSALDRRVRRLEDSLKILSPPPVMELSWDGLVWRLWRLRERVRPAMAVLAGPPASGSSPERRLLPNPEEITLDSVKYAIESIKTPSQAMELHEWPKCANDDDMLSIVVQTLCHIAGKRYSSFDDIPLTKADIYVCAVHLSLSAEASARPLPPGVVPLPPPAPLPLPVPPPPSFIRRKPAKSCCGCCSCYCHTPPRNPIEIRRRRARSERTVSTDSYTDVRDRKKTRFGWLSKLFFWRKPKPDRRGRSLSSSSSGTIYD